jgi:hypothetical protein
MFFRNNSSFLLVKPEEGRCQERKALTQKPFCGSAIGELKSPHHPAVYAMSAKIVASFMVAGQVKNMGLQEKEILLSKRFTWARTHKLRCLQGVGGEAPVGEK